MALTTNKHVFFIKLRAKFKRWISTQSSNNHIWCYTTHTPLKTIIELLTKIRELNTLLIAYIEILSRKTFSISIVPFIYIRLYIFHCITFTKITLISHFTIKTCLKILSDKITILSLLFFYAIIFEKLIIFFTEHTKSIVFFYILTVSIIINTFPVN